MYYTDTRIGNSGTEYSWSARIQYGRIYIVASRLDNEGNHPISYIDLPDYAKVEIVNTLGISA